MFFLNIFFKGPVGFCTTNLFLNWALKVQFQHIWFINGRCVIHDSLLFSTKFREIGCSLDVGLEMLWV